MLAFIKKNRFFLFEFSFPYIWIIYINISEKKIFQVKYTVKDIVISFIVHTPLPNYMDRANWIESTSIQKYNATTSSFFLHMVLFNICDSFIRNFYSNKMLLHIKPFVLLHSIQYLMLHRNEFFLNKKKNKTENLPIAKLYYLFRYSSLCVCIKYFREISF